MAAIAIAGVGIPLAVLGAVAFGLAVWAGISPRTDGRQSVSVVGSRVLLPRATFGRVHSVRLSQRGFAER